LSLLVSFSLFPGLLLNAPLLYVALHKRATPLSMRALVQLCGVALTSLVVMAAVTYFMTAYNQVRCRRALSDQSDHVPMRRV
jgi:hypothetical protein